MVTEAKDKTIIIVGAGVVGLSTALHLARDGYKNVTVFDRKPLHESHWNPAKGCDGASADINKIFRGDYTVSNAHYQDLALEARTTWLEWNTAIANSAPADLPPPLKPEDKLFDCCGLYHLGDGPELAPLYQRYLETNRTRYPELRTKQFIKGDPQEEERLRKTCSEWLAKYHLFDHQKNGELSGYLDTNSGVLLADKACVYAYHLCKQAGVKFVMGEAVGAVKRLVIEFESDSKRVTGVETHDREVHPADTVIVASGGWTATLLPEANKTVEATGGTVMFIDVPPSRKDLWEYFHPDSFPIRRYVFGSGERSFEGSMFPITREGRLKFGFRARNFTNFEDHPTELGLRISTPRTKYSTNPIDTVPLHGLNLIKEVIAEAFPELAEIGFTESRLCWYPDSIDLDLVVDYVPNYGSSLFIASGAGGHGFKYLPVLGKYIKHQFEHEEDRYTPFWKWRVVEAGRKCNGLEEGEDGPREMSRVKMAEPHDFKFVKPSTKAGSTHF